MKKYRILSFMFLLSLLVLFTGCGKKAVDAAENSKNNTERAAKVISVDGKVIITKSEGKGLTAFIGMSLNQGDRIKTEEKSTIVLEIGEDKQLKISQNSELTVSSLQLSKDSKTENTRMDLDTGVVWINIKNKLSSGSGFEIKTPTAVMGVRGTVFSVLHDGDESQLAVIDGTVTATKTIEVKNPTGKITKKDLVAVVEKNQQLTIDNSIQSEEDFDIQPIYPEYLDPFILDNVKELIKTQPNVVDDILKKEINQLDKVNKGANSTDLSKNVINDSIRKAETEKSGITNNKQGTASTAAGLLGLPSGAFSSSGIEAKLPDGYPDSVVPVISGGKVVFGLKDKNNYTVVVEVPKSYKDVKDYYSGVLKKSEITIQQDIEGVYFIMGTKNGYSVVTYVIPEKTFGMNGSVGVAILLSAQN